MHRESVTRYVITHINKQGMRTLASAAQGRNTFETQEQAEAYLRLLLTHNPEERLKQIYGLPLEVRPCPCYPVHFDPQTVWFDVPEAVS